MSNISINHLVVIRDSDVQDNKNEACAIARKIAKAEHDAYRIQIMMESARAQREYQQSEEHAITVLAALIKESQLDVEQLAQKVKRQAPSATANRKQAEAWTTNATNMPLLPVA